VAPNRKIEISLSEGEAEALRTLLPKVTREYEAGGNGARLPEVARLLQSVLNERRRFLPHHLAGDPVCDMLLILFAAEARGEELSITRLGSLVGLPQATAARRISALSEAGLVQHRQDEQDRRRRLLELSSSARRNIGLWLKHVDEMFAALPGL
jgi:DNA-binding transcriptional ArsR family regulator